MADLQGASLAKSRFSSEGGSVRRRPFLAAVTASLVAFATSVSSASAISIDCTQAPVNPVGYEISATHADQTTIPRSAPAIAVLDTGIANVPELSGRIRQGSNVATGDSSTIDIDGHGTAVASIAAAASGGVRGVSPTSPVIPIKIFDDAGNTTPDDFIAGIERAVNSRAGVINISAAGSPVGLDAATKRDVQDAIDAAVSLGIPVIAASGNEGLGRLDVPASFAHVIAVGATDESGAAASFSNTGSGLDLVAPGSNIVTAAPSVLCSSGYGKATGTSFAAPLVSGAAALLLQAHPDLDVSQVTDMLRLHGPRASTTAWSDALGFGLLNVQDVLNAPVPTPDQAEVNDTISWAKIQSPVLSAPKRSTTLYPRIAPHQDPADVYRVKLRRGDRLSVRLQQPAGTRLKLSFGAKSLGAKRGTSFTQKIGRTGAYFVGVSLGTAPAAGSGYALTLKR
jgi:Subtilase family